MTKTKQKIKATDIIVVLDRSGSMDSIGQSTVDGFNSFIKEQRAAEGEANLTLVQFDNQYQVDYSNLDIKHVKDLILGETFVPRAMTALYDAIGRTIAEVKTKNDVVMVIITDGMENASREFNRDGVFKSIEAKKKAGWNFLFLAANQDAIKAGGDMGISAKNAMTYNANDASNSKMYMNFSNKLTNFRLAKMNVNASKVELDAALSFTEEDREDVKS
jgi:hypothetical protein